MCGLASIFTYRAGAPTVDHAELRVIRDHMTARGPDGAGEWFSPDGRVGLAHRRLSIIDLSPAGAQPMLSADGSLAVTFNGEIYNYLEIRADLERRGVPFRSHSDTEVLLHLYAAQGRDMVHRLRGMYAFALWDSQRQGLFLARDPFGIKPLYYADDQRTFRCASQVKALLAGGQIDTTPDPAGQVGFFLWGHVPDPFTLYRGIRALPAGHTLWVDAAGAQEPKPFCTVNGMLRGAGGRGEGRQDHGTRGQLPTSPATTDAPTHRRTDALSSDLLTSGPLTAASLRHALLDSVRHHLIADVPVGVFLSAGIDSTTLAALASETGGELRTVTLGFEEYRGTPNDEVPLAEEVARHYGARHQTVWIRGHDFAGEFDRLLSAMDQPSIDGVNSYFVSRAAREAGLKVAISGLGGDEIFGGYPSFLEIPRSVRLLAPFSPPRAPRSLLPALGRASRVMSAPIIKRLTSPKYASLFEYGGSWSGAYLLRRGLFMPWELPGLLDADLVRTGWERLQPLIQLEATVKDLGSDRARVSALELTWYMRNQLLRDTDWASMAHSLEVRVPLVDTTLLRALAPSINGSSHRASDALTSEALTSAPTKLDLALTPGTPLPPAILNRPKTGFQVPVRDWLLADRAGAGKPARGLRGWAKRVCAGFLTP